MFIWRLFLISVGVLSDIPSIRLSFWPDAEFWCCPCGTHYNLKWDLTCPGESLESWASYPKAGVSQQRGKICAFVFLLVLFAQEGLVVMEWRSLAGLAKTSLGTWDDVLAPTDQAAHRQ